MQLRLHRLRTGRYRPSYDPKAFFGGSGGNKEFRLLKRKSYGGIASLPQGNVQLMAKQQILGLKSPTRLEKIADDLQQPGEPKTLSLITRQFYPSPTGQCRTEFSESTRHIKASDFPPSQQGVRFTPESGHVQCISACPLCAKSGHCLFDHVVDVVNKCCVSG